MLREFFGLDSPSTIKPIFRYMENSLSPAIRKRAQFIKQHALCPVTKKPINFTCPKSGVPTHFNMQAWEADIEYFKTKKYEILRKANMYDQDLRSKRDFPELDFPGKITDDQVVNLLNWDTYFYTRDFPSMDTEYQLAIATKMLTYPMTIASLLDEFSPYSLKPRGDLTLEGLKSIAALRYTLFPTEIKEVERPMRFFILGARMESQLPWHAWLQMMYMFPKARIELVFIGPESYYDKSRQQYRKLTRPITERVDQRLSLTYHTEYFHTLNNAGDFYPYDPYLDAFFLFHPGLGAPESMDLWAKSVPGLLESKCAVFTTSFNEQDQVQDYEWLLSNFGEELDVLLEPVENVFKSTKWEFNDMNPQEVYQLNQRVFAFRGKRYHTTTA